MSPDPNQLKSSICNASDISSSDNKTTDFENRTTVCQPNDCCVQKTFEANSTLAITTSKVDKRTDSTMKMPLFSNGRGRRNVSPSDCVVHETFVDPQSPSSSSTTSQATSANDTTFEPTIEMMVNDFDDEQTLNEEEALAALESQDPDEEINTLKEESEMPLEELLAKYRALSPLPSSNTFIEPIRKKSKKTSSQKKKHKQKHREEAQSKQTLNESIDFNKCADFSKHAKANVECFNTESIDGNYLLNDDKINDGCTLSPRKPLTSSPEEDRKEAEVSSIVHSEISKVRRTHLLDLYPEGTFDNVAVVNDAIAGNSKETFYGAEDDEEIEEEEDDDYKKKVMIGTSYQATIPVGLSQYGDILPYENEDKLIWEPSQVSEREVEEYLIKIRDIKSNQQGEEDDEQSAMETHSENHLKENCRSKNNIDNLENNSFLANGDKMRVETVGTMEIDSQSVVKDNEQALHLLVQCGYDFKEALRRKRLNALPLNDCMSLWSEEECHKFEEGIQKYGKDFLKIRQNQVRTRTMRELVQFYYLWKKSERRDHNFANADTVDHMDIYLNEDNEYGSNPASSITPVGSPVGNSSNCTGTRRNSNSSQKNISIMTTTSTSVTNLNLEKNCPNANLQHHQQHHKRRTHSCNQTNNNVATSDSVTISENTSNMLTNATK